MNTFNSNIVFTLCSNNYLAQAKALGDSLMQFNPDYRFIIGLVDRLADDIDYTFFKPYRIIPIEDIGIDGFYEMCNKYDITELNTAVKPFLFDFIFKSDSTIETVIYFDPDILIYERLEHLECCMHEYNIVITPHFFTPIYDNFLPSEPTILNAGLYNLGFISVKRSDESQLFLKWWMIKLKDQCRIDFLKGLFVDQLWINFVPLYFEKVLILRHLGYNVAYWNFHERNLTCYNGKYLINNQVPLIFFHFSGYNLNQPSFISKYQIRYSFEQREDVRPLFEDYRKKVISNYYKEFSSLPCYYVQLKEQSINNSSRINVRVNLLTFLKRKIKKKIISVISRANNFLV